MASTYKTPGVYVEEITKFPPSVASVETAIPAFIGYTEKAEKNGESLKNTPTRIVSFLEFEQYFGGAPARDAIVRLNATGQYVRTELKGTTYLLYDSMRLFYDNGGGPCYIASVGSYKDPISKGNDTSGILGGLKALEKYDEPTLILSPDATSLDADLYDFQSKALAQCGRLQDRFLLCDLLKSNETVAGQTFNDRVNGFRDNIGINNLKYGAAYAPWLRTSIPAGLRFRDITFALDGDAAPTPATSLALLTSLTSNTGLLQLIYDLSNAVKAVNGIRAKVAPGGAGSVVDAGLTDLNGQLLKLTKDYLAVYNDPAKITYAHFGPTTIATYVKLRDILNTIWEIYDALPAVVSAVLAPSVTQTVEFKLRNDIDKNKEAYKAIVQALATHHLEIIKKDPGTSLLANDAKLTAVLNYAGYAGALTNVPKDSNVQYLYRALAVKKAALDAVKAAANAVPAGTTAEATATAVVTATTITTADLKIALNKELNDALAVAGVNSPTDLTNALTARLGAAGITDKEKITVTALKKYVDEEIAVNTPANAAGVVTGGFPDAVTNVLGQALLQARQTATTAAALPGANKTSVVNALEFTVVFPREYTNIASQVTATIGAQAINLFNTILNSALSYETIFDQSLQQSFGLYKTFVSRAGQDLMILPPGAAVAGIYAYVDNTLGVWKAPANVSLSSTLGPDFMLSAQAQEPLNIDANAGKSINAIRSFPGKGTLIWGARTLAGNDNEWRYIQVRRFFNYAEESIKKATEPFVFEANDRNTWVRVKAMIENFLITEWRRGALAGAQPADAFLVKCGLGETMTAQDILEGLLIVEIAMAVTRPAEFIILRFSHKMQES